MCRCFQVPLLTQLDLCSLFNQHFFHCVCVWIRKGYTLRTTWTCSCMATIFRAAQKRVERNVRPTCGPAKIILQQKDLWNYKYFSFRRAGSQCRRPAQGPCFWGPTMTYYDAASSCTSRCGLWWRSQQETEQDPLGRLRTCSLNRVFDDLPFWRS